MGKWLTIAIFHPPSNTQQHIFFFSLQSHQFEQKQDDFVVFILHSAQQWNVMPLVLSCAVICRTKVSPFGNSVTKTATSQKGLETCSFLSNCCQNHPIITNIHVQYWKRYLHRSYLASTV